MHAAARRDKPEDQDNPRTRFSSSRLRPPVPPLFPDSRCHLQAANGDAGNEWPGPADIPPGGHPLLALSYMHTSQSIPCPQNQPSRTSAETLSFRSTSTRPRSPHADISPGSPLQRPILPRHTPYNPIPPPVIIPPLVRAGSYCRRLSSEAGKHGRHRGGLEGLIWDGEGWYLARDVVEWTAKAAAGAPATGLTLKWT